MQRPQTVRRNSKAYKAALTEGTRYRSYTLSNGFSGAEIDIEWAHANLLGQAELVNAKMRRGEGGGLTLSFHSNHWVEIEVAQ